MSSNVRNIVTGKNKNGAVWGKYFLGIYKMSSEYTKAVISFAYANARVICWFVVTTGLITALPLVFEIKREGILEEIEKSHVSEALTSGKTPQDLVQIGMSGAIEPAVLS